MRGRPRSTRAVGWAAVAGLALLAVSCSSSGDGPLPQSVLDPAGPIARTQDRLWDLVFPIAVAVFILVQTMIIVAVVRFRDRGDDRPPKQVAGNTRLEVLWTIIPSLILVVIAVPTVATIFQLSTPPVEDALRVRVVGKQYWWQFEYMNAGSEPVRTAGELHVPTGREVFVELDGRADNEQGDVVDVIHSFWPARLAGKQDYVPGHMRTMKFTAATPGEYPGQCAEFCGLSHADMRFTVIAHEPADFDRWLESQVTPAVAAQGNAARGAELMTRQGCFSCHTVEGHPDNADARTGPSLTHFASRQRFAGYTYDRTDENVEQWIRDPQSLKLGAQMPDYGNPAAGAAPLTQQELDDLVAYLQSLE
jgi:cytochrome c oxidase subunit 2